MRFSFPNYTTSHEGEYTTVHWKDMKEDSLMDMPALFEFPGPVYLGITEAALPGLCGHVPVKSRGDADGYRFHPCRIKQRSKSKRCFPITVPGGC